MNSQRWLEWFRLISLEINEISTVTWGNINFTGSNITDIVSRQHNNLQLIQGGTSGQYYHLTAAQHAALSAGPHNSLSGLQGGTATEYYHLTNSQHSEVTTFFGSTDITAAEAETLTDGSDADSLHTHDGKMDTWVSAPATASSTGTAGQMAYDSSYLYICTATDTWRRVAHSTWT